MSITSTAVTRSVCHPGTLSGGEQGNGKLDEQGNGKLDEMTKKFAAVAAVADEAAAAPTVARMDEHRASVLIDSHGLTPAGRTDPAASSETSKLVSRLREDDSSAGWLDRRISELERLEKEGRLGQHPPADRQAYEQWKMGNKQPMLRVMRDHISRVEHGYAMKKEWPRGAGPYPKGLYSALDGAIKTIDKLKQIEKEQPHQPLERILSPRLNEAYEKWKAGNHKPLLRFMDDLVQGKLSIG